MGEGWLGLPLAAVYPAAQILEGAPDGFSTLAWSPQGKYLVTGGYGDEVMVWARVMMGKRFGGGTVQGARYTVQGSKSYTLYRQPYTVRHTSHRSQTPKNSSVW
jgi:hypothetical protein